MEGVAEELRVEGRAGKELSGNEWIEARGAQRIQSEGKGWGPAV